MTAGHIAQTTIEVEPPYTPEEAAEIREALGRYTADCRLLVDRHDELLARHGDRWVAMHDGTLYWAVDLDGLFDALRASNVAPGHAAVRFLHVVPPPHVHSS